jgi:hypothetical protein
MLEGAEGLDAGFGIVGRHDWVGFGGELCGI